jgi:signal transduction histidine kinase
VQRGLATELHLDGETEFDEEVDALLYRVAQEALRNAEEHASASSTSVAVRREAGLAVLSVTDDGAGIDPATLERARGEGHIGLAILADLASDAGGRLIVEPSPSGGTIVRVEVPIR